MKKRVRKKLHLKEFAEYGFLVSFRFRDGVADREVDRFVDDFIDLLETNQLQFGGGGDREWEGFICLAGRGSATDQHRELVADWFKTRPLLSNSNVGELRDAWYGA